jgi:hypothetical protein
MAVAPWVVSDELWARNASKHHLLVDATGIPLAWTVTGGNRHDVTQLSISWRRS